MPPNGFGQRTQKRRPPKAVGLTLEDFRRRQFERSDKIRRELREEKRARNRQIASASLEEEVGTSTAEPIEEDVGEPSDEAVVELSPAERGLEAAREIRELADQAGDMDTLRLSFPFLERDYGMEYIRFAGNPPQTPVSVQFKINPEFEVQLTGGHAVEMRSEGTGSGTSNASTIPSRTRVQWKPGTLTLKDPSGGKSNKGPYTVGRQMQAEPLSQDHATGSLAGADTDQQDWMKLLPAAGRRKATGSGTGNLYYIRGHLLNDNLGGIANEANLYPITNEANGQHKSFAEEFIKKGVDKGFVYSYSVEVKDKGFGYDPAVPAKPKDSIAAGGYTVDADLHFEFGRLDTAGKIIPKTRHKGVIESRYGATGTEPFGGNKATEFQHDFPGGSPSAATATGSELTLKTPQSSPVGSNAGLFSNVTSFGFSPVVSSLTPFGTGQKISPSATLVPTGDKLSLKQSSKTSVVNYFTQLVQGWSSTDVDAWYTAVTGGTSPSSNWQQIRALAVANKLDATLAAAIFQTGSSHLTRISINGVAVNT